MDVTPERFEQLVAEALDRLPKRYQRLIENIAVVIEDRSNRKPHGQFVTLGQYHGVPRIRRDGRDPLLPDRITFYRDDLAGIAKTETELTKQIEKTLWHEIGHHVGFSDPELRKLEQKRKPRNND